ncbi:cytochrome B [Rhodobacteraceae bacterium CCMM004]|nr:cytochrome B [Rhodobacteraceae bacterium CCMM004]
MTRRTAVTWLLWSSLAFLVCFVAVEPEDVRDLGAAALGLHAGVGVLFALVVAVWFGRYLARGLAGRPGPKLTGLARQTHPWRHRALYSGLVAMLAAGGLIGIAAPYVVAAFGVLPLGPGPDLRSLHGAAQGIHEVVFSLLIAGVVLHAVFHLWRHTALRDDALRIMVPRTLHRWL